MPKSDELNLNLFLVKGDIVGVEKSLISVDENGNFKADPIVLTSGVDMTTYWLNIAFQHLRATERAHKKLMTAKRDQNDSEIGKCLKRESASGMQTIVASGIAIDAYYASVKDCIRIPSEQFNAWREKNTARYKQIAEVLRLSAPMTNDSFQNLRAELKRIVSWRDRAVHPTSDTTAPSVHVELNKVTDWRYATFRYHNAKAIYGLTLSIVYKTASAPHDKEIVKLQRFRDQLLPKLEPWVKKWKRKYGELL